MPEASPLPPRKSPLSNYTREHIIDYPRLRLSERRALTAIQVMTFKGRHADAARAIAEALGVDCPTTAGASAGDGKLQVSWNGPNGWMIVASDAEAGFAPGELFDKIAAAVGELGAVVDQSHGRCGLRLSGECARAVMEKTTALDLHPRAFGPGRCALTSVAHMNATVVQVDDAPTYDLYVARSLARSFAHALEHACHEFERA